MDPEEIIHAGPYDEREFNHKFRQGDPEAKWLLKFGADWLKELNSVGQRSWDDLRLIRTKWKGQLVLKVIQCAMDAELAIAAGADGIVVSNNGGHQTDDGVSALWSLEQIMKSKKVKRAQAAGKFTTLFDSSIRCGPDIFMALALGAQAVLCKPCFLSDSLLEALGLITTLLVFYFRSVGRPYIYGLIVGGEFGVEHVIKAILAELELTMTLSGYNTIGEIQGKGEEVLTGVE